MLVSSCRALVKTDHQEENQACYRGSLYQSRVELFATPCMSYPLLVLSPLRGGRTYGKFQAQRSLHCRTSKVRLFIIVSETASLLQTNDPRSIRIRQTNEVTKGVWIQNGCVDSERAGFTRTEQKALLSEPPDGKLS